MPERAIMGFGLGHAHYARGFAYVKTTLLLCQENLVAVASKQRDGSYRRLAPAIREVAYSTCFILECFLFVNPPRTLWTQFRIRKRTEILEVKLLRGTTRPNKCGARIARLATYISCLPR